MARFKPGSGPVRGEWPLLLLAAAVLLPTVCVLWVMNRAIGDQRLAARQRMADLYRSQLTVVRDRLDTDWAARSAALDAAATKPAMFAGLIASGAADGLILLDEAGAPVYPAPARLPEADRTSGQPEWGRARSLEETDPRAAAAAFDALGRAAGDAPEAARAFQAAARCLLRAGRPEGAVRLVLREFSAPRFDRAGDLQGRLIAADALLLALQFQKPGDPRRAAAAARLRDLLLEYRNPMLPSPQRLFLMREMQSLHLPGALAQFPTFEAEELADRLLEAEPKIRADQALRLSTVAGVWKIGSTGGRVIALYRTATVRAQTRAFLSREKLQAGVRAEAAAPGETGAAENAIQTMPAGSRLPGWELALTQAGVDPLEQLAGRQMTLYVWIGLLMTVAIAALAVAAGRGIARSLRVAGMKADLVATVSHELKTPVSSMRLLVDTLLADAAFDPRKTREYLELIARANVRLGQLIENFLAFSRMERNKYAFEFTAVRAEDLVRAAVEAAGDRFRDDGCELRVEVAPGLPEIRADEGALVTALANLLDNAYKYSPGEKRIELGAFAENGHVCFEVRDQGIGIEPRDLRKIFRKFYQADSRLARTGGGCGLGLSIVRFLVEAHGGSVRVSSTPGKGSVFTVTLRAAS